MERRRRLHRSSTASGGLGWFWRWWGLPLLLQWSWCYQHSSQRRVHTRWLFCTLRSHKYTCTVRVVQSCGRLWWESRSPIINRRLLTLLLVDQILNEGLEPLNIECVLNIKVSFRVIQHVAHFMSVFPLVAKTALTLTAYSIKLLILHNRDFLIFLATLRSRTWNEERKTSDERLQIKSPGQAPLSLWPVCFAEIFYNPFVLICCCFLNPGFPLGPTMGNNRDPGDDISFSKPWEKNGDLCNWYFLYALE